MLSGQDSIDFLDKNNLELLNARDKRLKLGLDLKGGMYVVMDVDVVKLLEDMAKKKGVGQTKNPRTGRYVKIDRDKGKIVSTKKSPGPYKNVPIIRKKKD